MPLELLFTGLRCRGAEGEGGGMRTWTLESCKLGFLLWVHFIVCTVGLAVPASQELGRCRAREEMLSEL